MKEGASLMCPILQFNHSTFCYFIHFKCSSCLEPNSQSVFSDCTPAYLVVQLSYQRAHFKPRWVSSRLSLSHLYMAIFVQKLFVLVLLEFCVRLGKNNSILKCNAMQAIPPRVMGNSRSSTSLSLSSQFQLVFFWLWKVLRDATGCELEQYK